MVWVLPFWESKKKILKRKQLNFYDFVIGVFVPANPVTVSGDSHDFGTAVFLPAVVLRFRSVVQKLAAKFFRFR